MRGSKIKSTQLTILLIAFIGIFLIDGAYAADAMTPVEEQNTTTELQEDNSQQQPNESASVEPKEEKSLENSAEKNVAISDSEQNFTERANVEQQNIAVFDPAQNASATNTITEEKLVEKFQILGIELGRTTIKELEEKYQATCIVYLKKLTGDDWKAYSFDPNDFGTKELPLGAVTIFCDENGTVHAISLKAPVKAVAYAKSKYIFKDFVLSKEEQKENSTILEYKSANTVIQFNKTEKELIVRCTDNKSDAVKDKITDGKMLLKSFYAMDSTKKDDKTSDKKTPTDLISDGVNDLKPLGITIGTTTGDELRAKYDIIAEIPNYGKVIEGLNGLKTLFLNVAGYNLVAVGVNEKGIVQVVSLWYSEDYFKNISKRLSKKYSVLERDKEYILCKKAKKKVRCFVDGSKTFLEYQSDEYSNLESKVRSMPQNPAPYNIKLGEMTENEIRFKYKVVNEFTTDKEGRPSKTWKEPYFHLFRLSDNPEIFAAPNLTVLILDSKDFSSGNLPVDRVSVAIDESKKVCVVSVVYPKKMADYLNKLLKEKYKVSNDRSWRFVDRYVLYKANNAMVGLFFEPKEAKDKRASLLFRLYQFVDPLNGYDSVAINYCLEDVLKKYKQWVKETDQKVQNLL